MAIKNYTNLLPVDKNTTSNQPDLDDDSYPGAGDGDKVLSSQVESLRDATFYLQDQGGYGRLRSQF